MRPIRTLKEYESRYKHYKRKLLRFTKKEVEDFDKAADTVGEHYVLKHRKWVLLGDTYYEIPKPIRLTWFKGLSAAGKLGACSVLVGSAGVIGGGAYGIYALVNNNSLNRLVEIDSALSEFIKVTKVEKNSSGDTVIYCDFKKAEEMPEPIIQIGDYVLQDDDYEVTGDESTGKGQIKIFKAVTDKHPGKIVIKTTEDPISAKEWEAAFDDITVVSESRNFTTVVTDSKDTYKILTQGYHEAFDPVDLEQTNYVKYEDGTYYSCNSTELEWVDMGPSGCFELDAVLNKVGLLYFKTSKPGFKYSNGTYNLNYSGEGLTINCTIKFNDNKKITYFEYNYESGAEINNYKLQFSNYNKTEIENFPDEPATEISMGNFLELYKECSNKFQTSDEYAHSYEDLTIVDDSGNKRKPKNYTLSTSGSVRTASFDGECYLAGGPLVYSTKEDEGIISYLTEMKDYYDLKFYVIGTSNKEKLVEFDLLQKGTSSVIGRNQFGEDGYAKKVYTKHGQVSVIYNGDLKSETDILTSRLESYTKKYLDDYSNDIRYATGTVDTSRVTLNKYNDITTFENCQITYNSYFCSYSFEYDDGEHQQGKIDSISLTNEKMNQIINNYKKAIEANVIRFVLFNDEEVGYNLSTLSEFKGIKEISINKYGYIDVYNDDTNDDSKVEYKLTIKGAPAYEKGDEVTLAHDETAGNYISKISLEASKNYRIKVSNIVDSDYINCATIVNSKMEEINLLDYIDEISLYALGNEINPLNIIVDDDDPTSLIINYGETVKSGSLEIRFRAKADLDDTHTLICYDNTL